MFIPLVKKAEDVWGWTGENPTDFLVLCTSAQVYSMGFHARGEPISCKDSRVLKAFQVYGEVMALVIGLTCEVVGVEDKEDDQVRNFRSHLHRATQFQTPFVPPSLEGDFLKITLAKVEFDRYPTDVHPSPDPLGLMCRSFNAFSTWLYQKEELVGVRKDEKHKYCRLFPSCSDDPGNDDCCLCIASNLFHGPFYCRLNAEDSNYLSDIVCFNIWGEIDKCRDIWQRCHDGS
jgi:hypothetical protein